MIFEILICKCACTEQAVHSVSVWEGTNPITMSFDIEDKLQNEQVTKKKDFNFIHAGAVKMNPPMNYASDGKSVTGTSNGLRLRTEKT